MPGSPFLVRGVVEGFYGVFYTFPQRDDLIRFLGRHGFNLYIYGPKNDRQHRARWREPYPAEVMARFGVTAAVARASGVTFCYALSPVGYAAGTDFQTLTAKLGAFFDQGVRAFSILLDDIALDADSPAQAAEQHAALGNRLYAWLQACDPACTLSFCPTDYHGVAPFGAYLHTLGAGLHPAIDLFYTGPQVCSTAIAAADAAGVAAALRRPPLIWDNYPVNDLAMRPELHLGPIRGRDPELATVVRGIVVNPMSQAEASKIALLTWADYLRDPAGYAPAAAWEQALEAVAGTSAAALRQFAATTPYSCLEPQPAPPLAALAAGALAALRAGADAATDPAVAALRRHLDSLDDSCYLLKHGMANLALRADLLPWISALENWIGLGRSALLTLERLEGGAAWASPLRSLKEALREVRTHPQRSAGRALLPLVRYALSRCVELRVAR